MIGDLTIQDIKQNISKLIMEIINTNIPYKWIAGEVPFENRYGKTSYDYSGDVAKMTIKDFEEINSNLNEIINDSGYFCMLEALLSSVYINSWSATYCSNRGKNYINYYNLLQNSYEEWKSDNFDFTDEEGYLDEEKFNQLNSRLNDIFDLFISNEQIDLYYEAILKTIN